MTFSDGGFLGILKVKLYIHICMDHIKTCLIEMSLIKSHILGTHYCVLEPVLVSKN